MGIEIEKDWITEAGLRAVVLMVRGSHRCGYVEVLKGNPLFGVDYGDKCPALADAFEEAKNGKVGKRGILTVICADEDTPSPGIVFDVHGSLTYSGSGSTGYPVKSDGWWFGFDAAHHGDGTLDPILGSFQSGPVRSLDYMADECESLASQIVAAVGK